MIEESNGYNLLVMELVERGFPMRTISYHERMIKAIVEILATDEECKTAIQVSNMKLEQIAKECADLRHREAEIEKMSRKLEALNADYRRLSVIEDTTEKYKKLLQEFIDEKTKHAREFSEKLLECETPEGRDLMRRAVYFKSNISVNTKYDNTAYIIALGAMLTAPGSMDLVGTLRKINKNIPDITVNGRMGAFTFKQHDPKNMAVKGGTTEFDPSSEIWFAQNDNEREEKK